MKLLNWLRRKDDIVERPRLTQPETWDLPSSYSGERVGTASALGLSAVWACVNLLAGSIGSLPLNVYRTDAAGNRIVAKDHPLYRVLHDAPNTYQTALDFWEFMSASVELRGNAYARIMRSAGAVSSLMPMQPDAVSVRRASAGKLEYSWSLDGKSGVSAGADILHIRGFGGSPQGGLSTLTYARQSLGLALAIDRAASSTFKNGLRPSGVLKFAKFLTDPQRTVVEEKLAEKFAGAINAGRPFVLEGGSEWQSLAIDPEDAQMLQSRGFGVEDICRWFGVPPFMVGHTEKSTSWGTGLEQQVLGFVKFTLRRRLRRIEAALMQQLLSPDDRAAGVSIEFNIEGLLRGDSSGRARFYQQMTAIGAMTINEVRALENLPAVEGGDVPRMQMQNVPIAEIDREALRQALREEGAAQ
ncbi:phage portal protein [Labrys sp. 22185]|uniref:phage portal protein n=1 Tax=Labrys sp. 22185 TaxID=3453888 RepID=UPI003F8297FC